MTDNQFDNVNRCVYCGTPIPEGRQYCYECGHKIQFINEMRRQTKEYRKKKQQWWLSFILAVVSIICSCIAVIGLLINK